MPTSTSKATWTGSLKEGRGVMQVGPGHYEGPFTFASRFETGAGTNPEELIGAAHAGCYSMFLSALLDKDGHKPISVKTTATVHLGEGPAITQIDLNCEAEVPYINEDEFLVYAEKAKAGCPVSKALSSVKTTLNAVLVL